MSQYAARIRAARGYAGMTQEQLAQELGVDAQTIKRRESGSQEPKKGERRAIAAICGVPPEFMENGWAALATEASPRDEIGQRLAAIEGAIADALVGDLVGELQQIVSASREETELLARLADQDAATDDVAAARTRDATDATPALPEAPPAGTKPAAGSLGT